MKLILVKLLTLLTSMWLMVRAKDPPPSGGMPVPPDPPGPEKPVYLIPQDVFREAITLTGPVTLTGQVNISAPMAGRMSDNFGPGEREMILAELQEVVGTLKYIASANNSLLAEQRAKEVDQTLQRLKSIRPTIQ